MSVRFVLGPAGSGKTQLCLNELAQAQAELPLGSPLLFLLPQQATFLHERLLASACPGGGFCRVRVSGFSRLAAQAYLAAGQQRPPALSEAGKLLLMRAAVQRRSERLRVFSASARWAGFAQQLVAAAEEMQVYGLSPQELAQAAVQLGERGEQQLADKLTELSALYDDYLSAGEPAYGGYAADLAFLAQHIRSGAYADTAVWVDGYAEFSPLEQQVLAALFAACPRVTVCLAVDPAQAEQAVRPEQVFYPGWHTYAQLSELARREGAAVEPPLLLGREQGRFAANAELDALERALAGQGVAAQEQTPLSLHVLSTADRRDELTAVGREICRLVREEGLRYREIGLIARDSQPYEDLLPTVFGGLGLPYFVDSKKPLLYHPLLELVRAALEVWAFRAHYRHIQRLLKNPLGPLSAAQSDRMDNYCLAHGVRFYHWPQESWQFARLEGEDEQLAAQMDALHAQVRAALLPLLELGGETDAQSLNAALRHLLAACCTQDKLDALAQQALDAGRGEAAAQHQQAWGKLSAFLDEADLLLGADVYPAAQLAEVYNAALAGLTASTIPAGLDQILVSSLERSRNPELKAAFVLGVNDGQLPRRITSDGLLSDSERTLLASLGLPLAPDAAARQFRENYLAYVALTRSGSRLWLSYVRGNEQGQAQSPSPLLRQVRAVFPQLAVETPPLDAAHLSGGPADAELLAAHVREDAPLWNALHAHYQRRTDNAAAALEQGLALSPLHAPLSREHLRRLYGNTLRGSVSRLERYRRCPFSYFATYGLRLSPRREYLLTPADRGELFHAVLSQAGQYINEHHIEWESVDEALAATLVDGYLGEQLPRFLAGVMNSSARYRYLAGRIRDALVNALLLTAEHMRHGRFRPVAYELPFGSADADSLPPLLLPLDDGRLVQLSGRIDRVDMAEQDGRAYFRVVDYKTGAAALDRRDMAAGLKLQLLVYLQVVLDNSAHWSPADPAPAGLYYAAVRDVLQSVAQPGEAALPGLKLSGLTVADPAGVQLADPGLCGSSAYIPVGMKADGSFYAQPQPLTPDELAALREHLSTGVKSMAAALLDGLIPISPLLDERHDACEYCDFISVCGLERDLATCRTLAELLPPDVAAAGDGDAAEEAEQ